MKKYLRVENEMIEVELREEGSLIPLFLCSDVDEMYQYFEFVFCPICGSNEITENTIIHKDTIRWSKKKKKSKKAISA